MRYYPVMLIILSWICDSSLFVFLSIIDCLRLFYFFFFLMTRRPPRSPLFPSTPLFRPPPPPVEAPPPQDDRLAALSGVFAPPQPEAPPPPVQPQDRISEWSRPAPAQPVEEGEERSEEHTSELQSLAYLVCRLLLEKKKN